MLWRPHTVEWIPGCPPRLYSRHCSPPPAPDNPPPYSPEPPAAGGDCGVLDHWVCTNQKTGARGIFSGPHAGWSCVHIYADGCG